MAKIDRKLTFGVIVGTRGFFSSALAAEGRKVLLAKLKALGYNAVILPRAATPTGAVETLDDAAKCAALFSENRARIDGVIVALPNFGDELGVVNTLAQARLGVPVLVQASDDELDKVDTAHRRDSFCGKLSVCNNLYQYGIPFTDTSTHTLALESDAFTRDLDFFGRVCRVVRGLRSARIGAVGARPGAFQTMRVSEKLLQAAGITVVTVDLSEIIGAAGRLADGDRAVKAKANQIADYGRIEKGIGQDLILRQARLSVTLDRWVADNGIDAAAVQCWTSIQQNYGCAACLSMSLLGERLIPAACEVDVNGVVSMYALVLASGNPAALLDWNNNYGDDRDKCVSTHCSSYPRGFIAADIEIGTLAVLGNSLGKEKCFGGIKGKVAAGPMTYFRISNDDVRGRIRAYVGDAEFTDDPFDMDGGIAVCRVPNLQRLMKFMCRGGFEHHVGMARGASAAVISEAVRTYLGWDLYVHE